MFYAFLTVTPVPISNLFTGLGDVTTGIFDMVQDVVGYVIANPILLVGFGIGILGLAIGLFKKFL